MPRQKYPSDHRRWFRVMEDILDDPKLNGEEWVWGAYIRTLAMLNRTKSKDGILRVSGRQLGVLMGRSRGDIASKRLASAVHLGLITAARYADYTLIMVTKWPEHQGFAPARLRPDSVQTPSPKTTPTPTPKKEIKKEKKAALSTAPSVLSKEDRASVVAWFSDVLPMRVEEADGWIEECLSFHRAKGSRWSSWPDVVTGWVRRGENRKREQAGEPLLRSRAESIILNRQVAKMRAQMDAEENPSEH